MGDVTLVVPTVRSLQKAFPHARITWIISQPAYALIEGLDGVDFVVIDKPRSVADYLHLRRRLAAYNFDLLLALQANLRVNLIYPLIRATRKIGFDRTRAREGQWLFTHERIPFTPQQHLLESFLSFAHAAGAREADLRWDLPLCEADWRWADEKLANLPRPWLAINPSASKAERNWPLERYVEVVTELAKSHGGSVILTGGPAEEEKALAARLHQQLPAALDLVGATSPKQLAAVLGRCDALLAPDTGPVHIAVAMGTPVVGLYAVAPPSLSGPYTSQQWVANRYPDAVRQFLHKDAESVPWNTRVHDTGAMRLITAAEVTTKLRALFDQPGQP